ncbi:MAG: 4Fe-4S dicluster domain-containing protein [Bryobacterales bacterium]|nr:4Fe-4S dicluster domain-containing protein [Bryobacteraceae bacterium]MDW8130709.1 4Fe-4S dicluster domain-containing protein [Bryobacterales bacterium]
MRALLFDVTRCVGCGACVAACCEANGLPGPESTDLGPSRYTVVRKTTTPTGEVYYRRLCMHCLDPACASVCPIGALKKSASGPVVYDASVCMGCRYCLQACPFEIPRYEWNSRAPKLGKCSLCAGRLAKGKPTACAEVCPTGATIYGERTELLKEARARIAAEPDKYVHHVYGEREVGGTCVLFLSNVPFRRLGLPENLPLEPLPNYTGRALSQIPPLVGSAGILLAGLWWLTNRKQEVARAECVGRAGGNAA